MIWLLLLGLFQTPGLPARTVAKGAMSGIEAPRQVVVRTAAEWNALWREVSSTNPLPAVDFSRDMVVGVFVGTRPTAGYGVEIRSALAPPNGPLIVQYVETAPARDAVTAQVLTAPYHLVAIPKRDGDVRFQKTP